MTALMPPVPRRPAGGPGRRDRGDGGVPDLGSPLFGVDLDNLETRLDEHPWLRDEVNELISLATRAGARGAVGHDACSVLVGVVIAKEQIESSFDWVVGNVADVVTDAAMAAIRRGTNGALDGMLDEVLEVLVSAVVDRVVGAAFPGVALWDPEVLVALRLAAILACPDPDLHPDVVEHCLRPLATTVLLENDDLA